MSDLPEEVMNRAVDQVMSFYEDDDPWRMDVAKYVSEAAPILIEAERERVSARTELVRRRLIALMQAAEKGSGLIPAEVLEYRLQEILAALSVIDEEGGTVGSGNQEEQ